MTTQAASTPEKAVVDPIKMPKMKVSGSTIAKLNSWAIAGAIFFGYATIFAAIAAFTKKWSFGIPFIGVIFGNNTGSVSLMLLTALATVALSVFAIVTIGKITDAEALKKSWHCIANTFLGIAVVYVIDMIGIIMYSLMSIGRKSFDQGDLWLSSFLPCVILCAGAVAMHFIAKSIAAGKTAILRVLSIVAISVAAVALVLVFIAHMVNFYGKSSTKSYSDYYNSLFDLD